MPYDIQHLGGTATVTVNQREKGGKWNLLGTYSFDTSATIVLRSLGNGSTSADAVMFVPTGGGGNATPVLSTISDRFVNAGETFSFTVSATDDSGPPLLDATGLPPGASFIDHGDGTATFTWNTIAGDIGNHPVTFTATDASDPTLVDSELVTITVIAVKPVIIFSLPIAIASIDKIYFYDVEAHSLRSNLSIRYLLENEPSGMTIDSNTGEINWTPSDQDVGRHEVTVAVSDSNTPPYTARQTFQIDVGDNLPVFPGSIWATSTPESQGIDSMLLADAIDFLESLPAADKSNELVIVRNGYVIWQGTNVDTIHGVWSLTKSWLASCLACWLMTMEVYLDTPASDLDANLSPHYSTVTIRHFLTMMSGYRAIGDEPAGMDSHGNSETPFDPDVPLFTPPGSQFAYWDTAVNELGFLITKIAGKSMKAFFQERIGSAIGLDSGSWDWGDFGQIDGLTINGGAGNHGNHISHLGYRTSQVRPPDPQ